VPHFVQSSFEALLKHPNHAVTFDIHVYKSTAQRHQTSSFSDWSASAEKLTHSVFTIPTNVTRKLTRSGCPTFCCTNCLRSCPHLTWDGGSPRDHNLSRSWWTSHKCILYCFEFSLQRKWLDLQLLPMICSWTHGLSFKCPTTLPGTFCSCSYFTYHLEF
jgi:hypothetical protein